MFISDYVILLLGMNAVLYRPIVTLLQKSESWFPNFAPKAIDKMLVVGGAGCWFGFRYGLFDQIIAN